MADIQAGISTYLESEIAGGAFPGAQYVVGDRGEIIFEEALGHAVIEPERIAARLDTIYDLASLTKPLVTSLLAVILHERGTMDLRAPVAAYLSEFQQSKRELSLMALLTHTSGLPNWRPLYLEVSDPAEVPAYIAGLVKYLPDANRLPITYSDLNYILIGMAIERVTGMRLDRLADQEIIAPLGLQRTMFKPPPELKREIAATEHGQSFEHANADCDMAKREGSAETSALGGVSDSASEGRKATEEEGKVAQQGLTPGLTSATLRRSQSSTGPAPQRPSSYHWRDRMIWGEVHDGNAYYLGGVAGHAGLFSTAREVFQIANQFLRGSQLVSEKGLGWFTENLTPGRETSRTIGWVLAATADCSAGAALPPTAIGHNGFTGTSVWMDAAARRVFVLLTNRVHPRIGPVEMKSVRQRFNTLAVEALNGLQAPVFNR